ncbi:hypothetical protein Vafri_14191 [Volvox africanus]|uniref:Uncharacterized protein n=1 Tax=Volvox africanus TaxID=51714 RepID=A0A8J4BDH6_9CHLO|nr:hypothetical protein Vafri_14191 [Volvox africanus]
MSRRHVQRPLGYFSPYVSYIFRTFTTAAGDRSVATFSTVALCTLTNAAAAVATAVELYPTGIATAFVVGAGSGAIAPAVCGVASADGPRAVVGVAAEAREARGTSERIRT